MAAKDYPMNKPPAAKFHSSITFLAKRLGRLCVEKKLTLSVAESCTGGMIGAAITAVPGSSAYFSGGVVSYRNEMKHNVLGVPKLVLEKNGAVSAETVTAMVKGVRRLCKTDCAIAVSGIAGPDGGTKKKPVGLVYIGIGSGKKVRSFKYYFKGDRQEIRRQTVEKALERMIEEVKKFQSKK
jgi:PncC family amidohydrolase